MGKQQRMSGARGVRAAPRAACVRVLRGEAAGRDRGKGCGGGLPSWEACQKACPDQPHEN